MNSLLSQHLMDSFFGGVPVTGNLLITSKNQPVAEMQGEDCYLYHPAFYEQFDNFDDQMVPMVDENGNYSLLLMGDEYQIFRAVPSVYGWELSMLDPAAPEEALVTWTESFTLS